jgi:hypothetical protein
MTPAVAKAVLAKYDEGRAVPYPGTNPNNSPQSGVEASATPAKAVKKDDSVPDYSTRFKVQTVADRIAEQLKGLQDAGMNPVDDGSGEGYGGPALEIVRAPDFKIFALWPKAADKESTEGQAGLWQIIDGSAWSAIPVAMRLWGEMDRALTDEALSPIGRRAAVIQILKSKAAPSMTFLGRRWVEMRNRYEHEAKQSAGAKPYIQSHPWEWALDIEAGRSVRELPDAERFSLIGQLELGSHPDLADALLRLPAHLTGITPRRLARIQRASIERRDPGAGAREQVRSAALMAAATAIKTLYGRMMSGAWIARSEFHELMGAEACEALVYCGVRIADLVEMPAVLPDASDTKLAQEAPGAPL